MRYIVVDLEATCWENMRDFNRSETIEIGAVELPGTRVLPLYPPCGLAKVK